MGFASAIGDVGVPVHLDDGKVALSGVDMASSVGDICTPARLQDGKVVLRDSGGGAATGFSAVSPAVSIQHAYLNTSASGPGEYYSAFVALDHSLPAIPSQGTAGMQKLSSYLTTSGSGWAGLAAFHITGLTSSSAGLSLRLELWDDTNQLAYGTLCAASSVQQTGWVTASFGKVDSVVLTSVNSGSASYPTQSRLWLHLTGANVDYLSGSIGGFGGAASIGFERNTVLNYSPGWTP